MAKEEIQKEMQQKYMEMNYMKQHLEQYNKQLEMLDNQLAEIDLIMEGLKTISQTKPESELLVPISNGIFVKAKLIENDSFIVNVGSNITVEKDMEGTEDLLKKQKSEIEGGKIQVGNIIETITEQMKQIENEITGFMKAENV